MAISLAEVQTELEGIIGTQWSEVKAGGGIYDADQVERQSRDRISVPYAVIEFGELEPSDRLLSGECYELPIMLHYVVTETLDGKGGMVTVRGKLLAMSAYFQSNDPSYFDILEIGPQTTAPDSDLNATFIAKELPLRGGTLTLTGLVTRNT